MKQRPNEQTVRAAWEECDEEDERAWTAPADFGKANSELVERISVEEDVDDDASANFGVADSGFVEPNSEKKDGDDDAPRPARIWAPIPGLSRLVLELNGLLIVVVVTLLAGTG